MGGQECFFFFFCKNMLKTLLSWFTVLLVMYQWFFYTCVRQVYSGKYRTDYIELL